MITLSTTSYARSVDARSILRWETLSHDLAFSAMRSSCGTVARVILSASSGHAERPSFAERLEALLLWLKGSSGLLYTEESRNRICIRIGKYSFLESFTLKSVRVNIALWAKVFYEDYTTDVGASLILTSSGATSARIRNSAVGIGRDGGAI